MFSFRRVKQLVYGLLYVAFFCAVGAGVYFLFLKPAPSCFDKIQDGGETGVDCGGPCANICLPSTLQPISAIGNVDVFTPIAGHVTLLAQVENVNSDFAADTFVYTFNLYDASGKIIQSIPGTSFIYADDTKYLMVPNEAVSAPVDHAEIVIGVIHWVSASEIGTTAPQFSVGNIVTSAASLNTLTVSGTVTDGDSSAFKSVEIVVIFEDSGKNPVGVTGTKLDSIAPNQAENFSVKYPASLQNIDPSQVQVYAYAFR